MCNNKYCYWNYNEQCTHESVEGHKNATPNELDCPSSLRADFESQMHMCHDRVVELSHKFCFEELRHIERMLLGMIKSRENEKMEWKGQWEEWGLITHPELGEIMTYYPKGRPCYDSYTNPFVVGDGEVCYYRFDHDEGCWLDEIFTLAETVEEYNKLECIYP